MAKSTELNQFDNFSLYSDSEGYFELENYDDKEKERKVQVAINETSDGKKNIENNNNNLPIFSSSTTNNNNTKRRVVVSKEVDIAIEQLIEELFEYYIFSWYQPLIFIPNHHSSSIIPGEKNLETLSIESIDQLKLVFKYVLQYSS